MSSRNTRFFDEREEGASSERWLLTYSDMITLLLALFVVLFALSTIDKKKYEEFRTGVVQTFAPRTTPVIGGTGLLQQNSLVTHAGTTPPTLPPDPMTTLDQRLQAALAQAGVSQDAVVTQDQRGVVVRLLTDKVFFATYSADFGPVGSRVVDVVGQVVATLPNQVQVEGYTDNQPITGAGPYLTNFDLSAARAMTVVDRLVGVDAVGPTRISGVGYGDTRPIAPNDTPAHQAANRRVDVVVLGPPPAAPAPAAPANPAPASGTP
ncbi:MAG TPA: flagellar motor protein MotB, partial [Acidimicrobiales bacterium]|nr:flagellar motor protein MotB [Acidimicrobiales bacterium]